MIKKVLALGLVMIIGLSVFSGCGNNSGKFWLFVKFWGESDKKSLKWWQLF